jgi:hypothetical protein
VHDIEEIEAALSKARAGDQLTDVERATLREVLEWWRMWKAWGRLGRIILWLIISCGAIAAAAREVRTQWFGG